MYVRLLNFSGVKDIDGGVSFLREQAVPVVRQQKGFRGMTASVDRSAGVVGVLSLWESPEDREASFGALATLRQQGEGVMAAPEVENYEETVMEAATPPRPGVSLMVTRISMDPTRVDDNVAQFKSEVVPQMKEQPGFQAVRQLINRETGQGAVGTVWADQMSMQKWAKEARARRDEAAKTRGITFSEPSFREVVLVELP
jgi:heme-degrading monooxygenase HmoA